MEKTKTIKSGLNLVVVGIFASTLLAGCGLPSRQPRQASNPNLKPSEKAGNQASQIVRYKTEPSKTATLTRMPTVTPSPTWTVIATATAEPTATASNTPTLTSTPEPVDTPVPVPTATTSPPGEPTPPPVTEILAGSVVDDEGSHSPASTLNVASVSPRGHNAPILDVVDECELIAGEHYEPLPVISVPSDRPAELHPDLNLFVRSYQSTNGFSGIVDYGEGDDPLAPQLAGLFGDNRTPIFGELYRVFGWNWQSDSYGFLLDDPAITVVGMAVSPGEAIRVPDSGYTIGSGYEVMVLYASTERITLKYTREDNVVDGYTLHIENVCVEPKLLSLYQTCDEQGRGQLPALRPGQAIGRANGEEIRVAMRDKGSFMDPRSRGDWWIGR